MEKSSEVENPFQSPLTDESKNNEPKSADECVASNICSQKEIVYSDFNITDKNKLLRNSKLLEVTNDSCEKEDNSLKISSVLDPYCKTDILDESADFVECELKKKFKCGLKRCEILLCEICKEDITHLDVYNRGIHVNNCIDKQISSSSEVKTQTSETENVFILECPLCFKHFSSPELRSNHVKKCGKSKGLSTQSIIKALELQERHALERISLGLPAKPVKPVKLHKNPVIKRAIVEPKNKVESDIQLAKALSLSLTNSAQKDDVEISENITTVILKPPTVHQRPGKKIKKNFTPLLVLRTEEDRKKLLLDKVATIVTPVSSEQDSPVPDETNASAGRQKDDNREVPTLWHLSSKDSEKHDYYVEQLLDWVKPSDIEMGAKLCHLSQIPGHEIVTQLPCEYTFSTPEENDQMAVQSSGTLTATSLLSSSVIGCLRSLVASSWMSDVDIHTACGTVIPAHRLLLAVRCLPLKQDSKFCSGRDRVALKWETISFDAALQFLNFIYTGNIEIKENIVSDLYYLANKYEVFDLQTMLNANDKTGIESEMELNKKISPFDDSHCNSYSSSQLQAMEGTENMVCKSQEDMNMDLEIVYNCINSSLKPSQPLSSESFNLNDTVPFKCTQASETREDYDVSFRMDYAKCESDPKCSEKSTISNCLSLEDNCPTSPVIFDVIDSENDTSDSSDNDSAELPLNCSQILASRQSNHDIEELDLYSTESNNSEDSVKFLQSSYTSFNDLHKTPETEENVILSYPKFSNVTSSLKQSSPATNNLPPDSPKSDHKKYELTTLPYESNELITDVCTEFESPISSCSKMLHSSFDSEYEDKTRTFSDVKIKDASNNDLNHFSKVFLDNKSMLNETTKVISLVRNENVRIKNSLISGEFYSDCKPELPAKSSPIRSNILSAIKSYEYSEHTSVRNSASPEVLICDSDSDSKSQGSILCETPPLRSYSMNFYQNEIKCNIPGTNSPEECSPSLHKTPLSLCEPMDNPGYELFDYFDDETSFPTESETAQLQSPKSTVCAKEKQSAEADNVAAVGPIKYLESDTSPLEIPELFNLHSVSNSAKKSEYPVDVEQATDDSVFEPKIAFSKTTASSLSPSMERLKNISRSENLNAATPSSRSNPDILQPQFKLSDSPITPLPDYKSMMTPEIKQALKKIGVKALPRKKAIAILSHIYNETHPLVNGETNAVINSQASVQEMSKIGRVVKSKKRKNLNENVRKPAKKQQKENHSKEGMLASQESDDSSAENPEWLGCVPEITFSQSNEDSPTKPTKDVIESIKQYIQSNDELYEKILLYLPLNLIELHQELKNNNIKISIQKLMDFLDEQCITFTCPHKEEYRKKQTARTQRFRKNMIAKLSQQAS